MKNENIDLSATIGAAYTDVSWSHNGTGSLVQYAGDPSRATYIPAAGETGIIQLQLKPRMKMISHRINQITY